MGHTSPKSWLHGEDEAGAMLGTTPSPSRPCPAGREGFNSLRWIFLFPYYHGEDVLQRGARGSPLLLSPPSRPSARCFSVFYPQKKK